jgi:hypothetical protein
MSRNLMLAAVGAAGLAVIGCGPATSPTTDAAKDAANAARRMESPEMNRGKPAPIDLGNIKDKMGGAVDKAAGALDGKVKEVKDAIEKELPPIETKLGEIKKQMETEADAAKKKELSDKLSEGEKTLADVKKMITDNFSLEKAKDLLAGDALTKLKDTIMAKIADLKKVVGL